MNRNEQDWQALLDQARNGNREAFGILFVEYLRPKVILPHAKKMLRNEADAQDIAQNVAEKLFEGQYYKQPTMTTIKQFVNYVWRMTHNGCLSFLKSSSRYIPIQSPELCQAQATEHSAPHDEMEARHHKTIDAVRRELPEDMQQVLDWRLEKIAWKEIARRLNRPLTTVNSRFKNLLKRICANKDLRACWEEEKYENKPFSRRVADEI